MTELSEGEESSVGGANVNVGTVSSLRIYRIVTKKESLQAWTRK